MPRTFNVLTDPCIPVRKLDGTPKTVSLMEALSNSHLYKGFDGQTQLHNFLLTRFAEAGLLSCFTRFDIHGSHSSIEDSDEADFRWKELYEAGQFPEEVLLKYFEPYKDRFWIDDEDFPLMQSPAAVRASKIMSVSKMISDMLESESKNRLFQSREKEGKEKISIGEAFQQLLWMQNCADTSTKKSSAMKETEKCTGIKTPSPGAGWVGRIAPIMPRGQSLFETLMFNLTLLDNNEEPWPQMKPVWETERKDEERVRIAPPDNPAQLYTLQTRRLLLEICNGEVIGFRAIGGDAVLKEDIDQGYFVEQNSLYRFEKADKTHPLRFVLKRHGVSGYSWQELSNVMFSTDENLAPGVVRWLNHLKDVGLIPASRQIYLDMCAVIYRDQDTKVEDIFGDTLTLNIALLDGGSRAYQLRVSEMLELCSDLAAKAGFFGQDVAQSEGIFTPKAINRWRNYARAQMYELIDPEFRKFLSRLDPIKNNLDQETHLFCNALKQQVRLLEKRYAEQVTQASIAGRWIKDKKGNPFHVSYPESAAKLERSAYSAIQKTDLPVQMAIKQTEKKIREDDNE